MAATDRVAAAVTDLIVDRPRVVVAVFLLATAGFALGLGNVSTQAGTSQFTEDLPAQRALENVNEKFSPTFAPDSGTTQLIQRSQNVLARESLLRMLEAQRRLAERPELRVTATSSAASVVATTIDPSARTPAEQYRVIEGATEGEIDAAVRRAAESRSFTDRLSDDFDRRDASASATVAVVTHELPAGLGDAVAGADTGSPLTPLQLRAETVVASVGGDIQVFGGGIVSAEFENVIFDSLIIVVPAAVVLILLFLVVAYRDPVDLLLGLLSLLIAVVWTFGFLGLAGIAFSQLLIAVPPLLLAVGIDFGIHSINRYREERATGQAIEPAMATATRQLLVAFFIVTGTTVLGFAANGTSALAPIREFGLVAAVGITFTFLVFGVFLPASKALTDEWRERHGVPTFSQRPLGAEGSLLGAISTVGVRIARVAPRVFLALVVVTTLLSGWYGLGVDTSFSQDDFLPPEDTPAYLQSLPEPFRPSEYGVTGTINYLDEHFEASQGDVIVVYVEGPLTQDYALESFQRAAREPPDAVVADGRQARSTSVVDVIRDHADESASFRRLVARNDVDGDGVPDDNLDAVYAALFDSPAGDRARRYLTEDRRAARVTFTAKADASQDEVAAAGRTLAGRYRFRATPTGETVVFQAVSDVILRSAITSLAVALVATAVFLVAVYAVLAGRPSLGIVNLVPIVVTLALLAGTMRAVGLPFNALTATILSITIGLGTDYSAHVVHRFLDEYDPADGALAALDDTVRGTGSALAGSMITTTSGIGVLVLAVTPVLGQFGVLTALSVFYAYVTAVFLTPSALVVWERVAVAEPAGRPRATRGADAADGHHP